MELTDISSRKLRGNKMETEIRKLLNKHFSLPENLSVDEPIFSSSLLDSLNSVQLISILQKDFDVHIDPLEVSIEDIDTVKKITKFLRHRI